MLKELLYTIRHWAQQAYVRSQTHVVFFIHSSQDVSLTTVHVFAHRRADWVTLSVQCCWKETTFVFKFQFYTLYVHWCHTFHSSSTPSYFHWSTGGTTHILSNRITRIQLLGASFNYSVHVFFWKYTDTICHTSSLRKLHRWPMCTAIALIIIAVFFNVTLIS